MKKIVDGRKYDTDTAQLIWANGIEGVSGDDVFPDRVTFTLYRKPTGEFFMVEDEARIMPMTEEEALRWAEEQMDADTYEELLGPVPKEPAVPSAHQKKWSGMKSLNRIIYENIEQILRDCIASREKFESIPDTDRLSDLYLKRNSLTEYKALSDMILNPVIRQIRRCQRLSKLYPKLYGCFLDPYGRCLALLTRGCSRTLDVVRGRSNDEEDIAEVVRFYKEDLPAVSRQLGLRLALLIAALIAATVGEALWMGHTFGLI